MANSAAAIISVLAIAWVASAAAAADDTIAIAVPARAGAVMGTSENSDAFIWRLFAEQIAAPASTSHPAPVKFETWASDGDTFSTRPHWPAPGEPKELRASELEFQKPPLNVIESMARPHARPIDVPCVAPGNAAVGGFPREGSPVPCVAEETKRNFSQFKYIVDHHLNTKAGLAVAFANSFEVDMPLEAISVKGDWVPTSILPKWIARLKGSDGVEKLYYTTNVDSVEYALVALHVGSRQNPNWVWGTFEHQMNPGRCDGTGCYDSFGAEIPVVPPNKLALNGQYGACAKTGALKTLMTKNDLGPVWDNYCLKSTQVDYTTPDGTPTVLGNSVVEGIVGNGAIPSSSCISCHAYASFGPNGQPTASATAMLPFNPTGKPIPAALAGSLRFSFMWGVVKAP